MKQFRLVRLAVPLFGMFLLAAFVAPAEAARATAKTRATRTARSAAAAHPGDTCPPVCEPRVVYLNRPCCGPCDKSVTRLLSVCHPCTGCRTEVEVCVPDCCTGTPEVFSRDTLIGCGLVRFTWCCGHSVTIRFEHCGDLLVIYR